MPDKEVSGATLRKLLRAGVFGKRTQLDFFNVAGRDDQTIVSYECGVTVRSPINHQGNSTIFYDKDMEEWINSLLKVVES